MTGCKGEGSCTDGEWTQKRHRKGNQGWPEEGKGLDIVAITIICCHISFRLAPNICLVVVEVCDT